MTRTEMLVAVATTAATLLAIKTSSPIATYILTPLAGTIIITVHTAQKGKYVVVVI